MFRIISFKLAAKRCRLSHVLPSQRLLTPKTSIASIVRVSHFEQQKEPRTAVSRFFENSDVGPTPSYISCYFTDDDEPADIAWTFALPNGKDVIDVLWRYACRIGEDNDDEYICAFRQMIQKLYIEKILLESRRKRLDREREKNTQRGPERRPEKAPAAILRPGKERDAEIERRLRQRDSFVDIALFLERTPTFIVREAKRVLDPHAFKALTRRKKTGEWSQDEIQQLKSLRRERLPLQKIARLLRRNRLDVDEQRQKLANAIVEYTVAEGPQALPSGFQQSMFESRLLDIWHVLEKSPMTAEWREIFHKGSSQERLSTISASIPDAIKAMLGGLRAPTWAELEALPTTYTLDAGVYARLIDGNYEGKETNRRFLYVGSGTSFWGGLNRRISAHLKERKRTSPYRFQPEIDRRQLKGTNHLITLMTTRIPSKDNEDVYDARVTMTLAKAILTVWLGAFQSHERQLQECCPWDPETLGYEGLSVQNPLMRDVLDVLESYSLLDFHRR